MGTILLAVGALGHALWCGASMWVASATSVAQEDLPLRVIGITADERGARLSLRNDAAKPIVAWTLVITTGDAEYDAHHSHDRLRALVLERLHETVPYPVGSTRPLEPNEVSTMVLGFAADTIHGTEASCASVNCHYRSPRSVPFASFCSCSAWRAQSSRWDRAASQ